MDAVKKRLRYFKSRVVDQLAFNRRPGFVAGLVQHGSLERMFGCKPKALDAAAQYFSLDATSAEDRELLAYILADVVFGRQRGRPKGSKVAWDGNRLIDLAILYGQLKRANPTLSDSRIARRIADTKDFSKNSVDQIRQQLGPAKAASKRVDEAVVRLHNNVKALGALDPRAIDRWMREDLKEMFRRLAAVLARAE